MAPCSSILAWKIPQSEEPGGMWSTGPQSIGHYGATEHAHTGSSCLQSGARGQRLGRHGLPLGGVSGQPPSLMSSACKGFLSKP